MSPTWIDSLHYTVCLQARIILCLTRKLYALRFGRHRQPPKLAGMFFISKQLASTFHPISITMYTIVFVVVGLSLDVPQDQSFEKCISSRDIVHFVPLRLFRLKAENMICVHM